MSASPENPDVSITIVSSLPEGFPQGNFCMRVNSGSTFREVLRKLCVQTQVPMVPIFDFHTFDDFEVPMDMKLCDVYSVQYGEYIYWVAKDPPKTSLRKCWNMFWFMGALCILIALAGLATITYLRIYEEKNYQYAVIFDAGSSHTSMYLYKWEGEKINSTAVAIQDGSNCNSQGGGISSFAKNASLAGQSLVDCLDSAKDRIPATRHHATPVYLGATAGMRLLQKEDPNASLAVLESVRKTIGGYPFNFTDPKTQVRILLGSQEGAFSWITSNYVSNTFDVHPPTDGVVPELYVESIGTLDLGGASTQITFIPNKTSDIPAQDSYQADLYGTNYSLYTHSFLCYGVNEATRRVQAILIKEANHSLTVGNPCSPKGNEMNVTHDQVFDSPCVDGEDAVLHFGYAIWPEDHSSKGVVYTLKGESNATACQALVSDLFNFTAACLHPNCSFNGVFQPPIFGDFYGISSYFYVMNFLNLTTSDHVNHTEFSAATQSLCAKDWNEVRHMKTHSAANLPWYCFQSIYVDTLLVQGYGFEPNSTWDQVHFVESVGGVDVGWTLGFTIAESRDLAATSVQDTFSTLALVLLILLFCAFLLLSLCFARLGYRRCNAPFDGVESSSFNYQRIGYGAV